jgi:hypothetical protein
LSEEVTMRRILFSLPTGIALGAAAMYLLDPTRGHARRSRLRDKLVRLEHVSELTAGTAKRDMINRVRGLGHELRARLRSERIDDDVLVERARSKAGRAVSHPHALELHARGGTIIVAGDVLAHEKAALLERLRSVRGAHAVEDHLREHIDTRGVTLLQGPGRVASLIPIDWSPAARLLATLAGGALLTVAARRRNLPGAGAAAAGVVLALRGLTNLPIGEWIDRNLPRVEHAVEKARTHEKATGPGVQLPS